MDTHHLPHPDPGGWAEKLEYLHQAAIAVAGSHNINEALQTIADSARRVIGAEMSAIGVPGSPGEPMAHFVVSGLPPHVVARAGHAPMGKGVLGVLLKQGEPVRLKELETHEAYSGLPGNHPSIRSFLGVPVQSGGEVLGDLYLANKIAEDQFSAEDQALAELLAAHAAVSVQTLRFHKSNEEVAAVRATAQLAPLIEDEVLQAMFGAGLLLSTLDVTDETRAKAQIADIQQRLDEAIRHLRSHLMEMAGSG